ncbi:prokaryotic type I DNA topoisomerase [Dacryopinax primogenitus]|uniref:DNA topoisomerase n=1 Tax=Dacryopinax primogenitus (strain DJM 731) TaxID=1858805 RepID=M5G9P4_DACPD|nr:prokaryotic type I DNA topoisomerase [Dacryopinax primogenitus]EJU05529.1 prokaryotic type I DNA topoisomerase [Dacryopinax primogenitus]
MEILCVAEKPSIARAISQILSGGQSTTRDSPNRFTKNYDFYYDELRAEITVTSVAGHLMESDFSDDYRRWESCDPADLFDAPIITAVRKDGGPIARNLEIEARGKNMLMIWTDCDREGEHIGSEVASVCRKTNARIEVKRARFNAIIPQQIHHAARHPVELDRRQSDAVEARIQLDLRLGAAFTRMQTKMLQNQVPDLQRKMISYGPCQFPTLGFVVSRYQQVQAFVPETFWYIYLSIMVDGEETDFTWRRGHLFDFPATLALYELCVESPEATIAQVTKKPTKKWRPLPLTTVELQKSASRLLRLTPKRILDIADDLYSKGFLSYPRTETDQFDPDFDFMTLIQKQTTDPAWGQFAQSLANGGFNAPRKGKKNDKAHPPIHPTAHVTNLVGDDKRVYEYVTRRFLASCSKDAEGQQTTVTVIVAGEEFNATGLTITQRNYLEVFTYDKWSDKQLPDFEQGQHFIPVVCEMREGQTSRPSLLTEADLVGLMDENGIGTDATIAQHIQTIIDREYVMTRQEDSMKYLVPSTLGIGLVEGYNKIGFDRSLSKPQLRRETEQRMVDICEGRSTKNDMLFQFIEQYREVFLRARAAFRQVVESVRDYLNGDGNVTEGGASSDGDDNDDFGGENGGRPPRGTRAPARGGNRGAGTRGRARGTTAPRTRGQPRGKGPSTKRRQDDDSDDENSRPPRGAGATAVSCRCDVPAVERTVVKETSNKGRKFWTCPNDPSCGFFEWADQASGGSASKTGASSRTIPAKRTHTVYARRCKCDLTAVSRTVVKEGPNRGRIFWTCPNSENARCTFFEWDDEQKEMSGPECPNGDQPTKRSRTAGTGTTRSSGRAGGRGRAKSTRGGTSRGSKRGKQWYE